MKRLGGLGVALLLGLAGTASAAPLGRDERPRSRPVVRLPRGARAVPFSRVLDRLSRRRAVPKPETPPVVPEPASLTLVLLGLGGVVSTTRRRLA